MPERLLHPVTDRVLVVLRLNNRDYVLVFQRVKVSRTRSAADQMKDVIWEWVIMSAVKVLRPEGFGQQPVFRYNAQSTSCYLLDQAVIMLINFDFGVDRIREQPPEHSRTGLWRSDDEDAGLERRW